MAISKWIIGNLQRFFIEYETNDQDSFSGNNYIASHSHV